MSDASKISARTESETLKQREREVPRRKFSAQGGVYARRDVGNVKKMKKRIKNFLNSIDK